MREVFPVVSVIDFVFLGTFNCFCSSLHFCYNRFSRRIFSFVLYGNNCPSQKRILSQPRLWFGNDGQEQTSSNRCVQRGHSSPHSASEILCSDQHCVLRIFHLTSYKPKKSLFIIPAVNDVEWVLFSTVITSTLSTNFSQSKNSSVFHQIVDYVIPIIFKVYECCWCSGKCYLQMIATNAQFTRNFKLWYWKNRSQYFYWIW